MRILCFCVVLLLSVPHAAIARQQAADKPVAIPRTIYSEFTSKITGRPYALFVALPDTYAGDQTERYPVLYVSDGHVNFPLIVELYRLMRLTRDVRELVIVGIAGQNAETWGTMRFGDLTPTRLESREAVLPKVEERAVRTGGAPGFLRVIAEEVIPSITARYRVSDDRSYYGHSLGGLFGAYVLFQSPQLFKRMILVSPALYWDDGVIFRSEETFAVRNKTLSAEVFLAAGDLEVAPMIPNVSRFSEALERRRYEGLKLHTRIFSDETHTSIAGVAMTRGLRTLLREVAAK